MNEIFSGANIWTAVFIGIYILASIFIISLKRKKKSFNIRVLSALGIGLVLGVAINLVINVFYANNIESGQELMWQVKLFFDIFGDGYINLLKLMVIPLIFVAMISSVMNIESDRSLVKIVPKVLLFLIITVSIAAIIGIIMSIVFNLDEQAMSIVNTVSDTTGRTDDLESIQNSASNYSETILSFIPTNLVYMLSGQTATATLSTVLVGMFIGYSVFQVKKRKPEKVKTFIDFIEATKEVVLSMVKEIIKLTPFGVMALMARFVATSNISDLSVFVWFVLASYAAIITMYIIHMLILSLFGLNPIHFIKKTVSTLLFAFSSRSSAATLPHSLETQKVQLGVDEETANIAGTFGISIGQNGCAGIYPAMVVIMSAYALDPSFELTLAFIVKLVLVIAVSSFGIAGVGGGATFAAVAVLSIMGYDLSFAALLVAIEPLIDMARTALNVTDGMTAGVVTARINKTLDIDKYKAEYINLDETIGD